MTGALPADPASDRPILTYIGVGANLGDPRRMAERTIAALGALAHSRLVARSSLYRSAAVEACGPDYVNAVVALETRLDSHGLLAVLQTMEQAAGRERPYRNAPRTLDLDILLFGDAQVATPQLTVPHPRMRQRAFVLVPLAEIAPHLVPASWLAGLSSQAIARITPGPD